MTTSIDPRVGYTAIQQDGVDAVLFNSSGIYSGDRASFRNKIINGNFTALQVINQRGSAARNTTSNAYNFDRWFYHSTNTTLTQAIESLSLQASTVYTVNWTGTATCEYIQSASAMATVVAAGGWTSIAKGGTLTTSATTVSAGLHLFIRFVGVNSSLATLDMVQVEQGSLATQFEYRPYGYELALCQRYLPAFNSTSASSAVATAFTLNTTTAVGVFNYPVTPRITPTGITINNGAWLSFGNGTNYTSSAINFSGTTSINQGVFNVTIAGATANQGGYIYANNASFQLLWTGCEL